MIGNINITASHRYNVALVFKVRSDILEISAKAVRQPRMEFLSREGRI